ncbi:uncharacterized protein LOC143296931 [Babylonia areolata]|uniref:uncharacterized protein LOC143296931 n=1 Tax=Babylonia areolata TaxID=304850 RepID=UPI003FCEE6CC
MPRTLHIKAYLVMEFGKETEKSKEVRRFQLEDGGERGLDRMRRLRKLVETVFNVGAHLKYRRYCDIKCRDKDGRTVRFSEEKDFQDAVDSMTDDTLRIYVEIDDPFTPLEESERLSAMNKPKVRPTPRACFPYPFPQQPPAPCPPHYCDPPPPISGHWAHGGSPSIEPTVPGGSDPLKGGWKGDMYFGCPWGSGRELYGTDQNGSGSESKERMTCQDRFIMEKPKSEDMDQIQELKEKEQVSKDFKHWVRQYARDWHQYDLQIGQSAPAYSLPPGMGPDFLQWLRSYLTRHYSHKVQEEGTEEEETQEDVESAPECLTPLYYRWVCKFLRYFFTDNGRIQGGACRVCQKEESGRNAREGGQKKGPKGFRKYVCMSYTHLVNGKKGEDHKIKEKATRAGLSAEVQEFVDQVMMEWQAKLTHQQYHIVAKEMTQGERTLPAGLLQEHFLWLVSFLTHMQIGPGRLSK